MLIILFFFFYHVFFFFFFFFNDTATTEIYTLSLHDALPISLGVAADLLEPAGRARPDGVGSEAHAHARRAELLHPGEVLDDGALAEARAAAPGIGDREQHELDPRITGGL